MSNKCGELGTKTGIYTGNQVGWYGFTGDLNFVSGGGPENGITAGKVVVVYIPPEGGVRHPYKIGGAELTQDLLDISYPEIEFQFIADITLKDGTIFRVSNRNTYVQDENGIPRFYEGRAQAPTTVKKTLGEWLRGEFEIGEVLLTVSNSDGLFDNYLPNGEDYQNWTDTEVFIRIGFGEDYNNYIPLYKGFIPFERGLEVEDDELKLRIRDQFEKDQIKIPTRTFTKDEYPFIAEQQSGKRIPLVYGDWTTELGDNNLPQIEATCVNGDQVDPTFFLFKVCDNSLQEITEITVERGDQGEDKSTSPARIDINAIDIFLEDGQFSIPLETDVFLDEFTVVERGSAQAGTTINKVSTTQKKFTEAGVQVNDSIINLRTGDRGTITQVQDFTIDCELEGGGNIDFQENDEFRIKSFQYSFVQGDSIRIKCQGKNITLGSYTRLKNIDENIDEPRALSSDTNGTYFVADDALGKIFRIKYKTSEILNEILYTDIAPGMTSVGGIAIQPDHNLLWLLSRNEGYIYQYNITSQTTEVSINTDDVIGLPGQLTTMNGLGYDPTLERLWLSDENEQTVYEVDPFPSLTPSLISSFPFSNVSGSMNTVRSITFDPFQDKLVIISSDEELVYQTDLVGTVEKSFGYLDIYKDVTDLRGVTVAQDSSWFLVDRNTDVLYNFLPYIDINGNPGFQVKDLLSGFAGKTFDDFNINWNTRCVDDLSQFKSRFLIDDDIELVEFCADLLEQFNTEIYIDETKYQIWYNYFDNYDANGFLIAERDIILGSFDPKKEQKQYFNSADSLYRFLPASDRSLRSETFVSNDGIQFASKEVKKEFKNPWVYREADINQILGVRINQSVPEPEIIQVNLGWRTCLLQLTDMVKILFADEQGGYCAWRSTESSRRFLNIPGYIREISYNLENMTIRYKIWSLGTTEFDGFIPAGNPPGGKNGGISTNLNGNLAYISPTGVITNFPAANQISLRDEDGFDAESREDIDVGNAWTGGYIVSLIDGITHEVIETNEIDFVTNETITFVNDWVTVVENTVLNNFDVIVGGHYLTYANYYTISDQGTETTDDLMKERFSFYTRPKDNAALTISQLTEENASGAYDFDDGRKPYVFSKD